MLKSDLIVQTASSKEELLSHFLVIRKCIVGWNLLLINSQEEEAELRAGAFIAFISATS